MAGRGPRQAFRAVRVSPVFSVVVVDFQLPCPARACFDAFPRRGGSVEQHSAGIERSGRARARAVPSVFAGTCPALGRYQKGDSPSPCPPGVRQCSLSPGRIPARCCSGMHNNPVIIVHVCLKFPPTAIGPAHRRVQTSVAIKKFAAMTRERTCLPAGRTRQARGRPRSTPFSLSLCRALVIHSSGRFIPDSLLCLRLLASLRHHNTFLQQRRPRRYHSNLSSSPRQQCI